MLSIYIYNIYNIISADQDLLCGPSGGVPGDEGTLIVFKTIGGECDLTICNGDVLTD